MASTAAGGPPTVAGPAARAGGLVAALVVALSVLVLPAAPARAHAGVLRSSPAAGSVIGTSPTEVTVVFSEPVTAVQGRIQVVAPDGSRIGGTPRVTGSELRIPVRRADQPLGTYVLSYRVVSADSHPVGGALTFSVGAPSARPPQADDDAVHPSVAAALPVVRWLGYAGLSLAVGAALLLGVLWPRRLSRRGAARLVGAGLGAVGLGAVAGFWLQAPYSSGTPAWDVSPSALGAVLTSTYGMAMIGRTAAVIAVAALLPPVLRGTAGRGRAAAVAAVTAGGLVTWPLAGHAAAAPLTPVVVAADVVHLAAMAVWLGGLVVLAGVLLRRAHPRALAVVLPVWSRWAAAAVLWLVVGGAAQAVALLGPVDALWRTGYGRLLLGKVAVLGGVLVAAALARRLVARVRTGAGPAGLRRTVGVEVAGAVAVLALSSVLVQTTPGRNAGDERAPAATDGVSQTLTSKLYTLQFNIYPVQQGENNTVHAFLYTPAGQALPGKEWNVSTRLQGDAGLEPVRTPMLGLQPPHHALGALTFPLPGTYEVRFTIRTSDIDQATVTTTVTVPAPPTRRG